MRKKLIVTLLISLISNLCAMQSPSPRATDIINALTQKDTFLAFKLLEAFDAKKYTINEPDAAGDTVLHHFVADYDQPYFINTAF